MSKSSCGHRPVRFSNLCASLQLLFLVSSLACSSSPSSEGAGAGSDPTGGTGAGAGSGGGGGTGTVPETTAGTGAGPGGVGGTAANLPETTGGVGAASAQTGGLGGGGAAGTGLDCTPPEGRWANHPGNYDNKTCDSCHTGLYGGWVYNNAEAHEVIAQATVVLKEAGEATVTGTTGPDGFFVLDGLPAGDFAPCVSLCSDTTCATRVHDSIDCQSSSCHGAPGQRIYLTQAGSEPQNTGGGAGAGGDDCIPPAPGGPRTHSYVEYDYVGCQICHNQEYTGAFLYDSITGGNAVAQATITLTPVDGSPVSAISGPDGMFYFEGLVPAPYTACVSKCPDTVCSGPSSHPDQQDCRTCHIESMRIHLP